MFDGAFEQKVLACLYRSKGFAGIAGPHLRPSYFTNPVRQNLAKVALEFFAKYQTTVSQVALVNTIKEQHKAGRLSEMDATAMGKEYAALTKVDTSDEPYVLDRALQFVKDREIRKFIEDAVKKRLPKGDFKAMEDEMARILTIQAIADRAPVEYWDEARIDHRMKRREDERLCKTRGISTGIKKLDDALDKAGWYKKELYVALGKAKFGKTMFLLWNANQASLQGFNVAYFTCETPTERLEDRNDAMNAEIEIRWLPDRCKEAAKAIKGKRPEGKIFFLEYPTKTLTPGEIKRQVKRLEMRGVRIDMIVVDYADIMRSQRQYDSKWDEQVAVYEDLRGIAGEFEVPLLTAGQVTKEGSKKTLVKGADGAGAWDKISVVDGCLTLCGSEEDLKKGEALIHLSEFRNSPSTTLRIKTSYNFGKFYKEFVEEV